ncbi:MAG: hypothetical protein GXC76_00945 [Rhodanobacteraceae bacterium]|nr:hypothetical protein [Rhodanobacteraceae bacterium]
MSEHKEAWIIATAILSGALLIVAVPVVRDAVENWRAQRALAELSQQLQANVREAERQAAIAAYRRSSAASPVVSL